MATNSVESVKKQKVEFDNFVKSLEGKTIEELEEIEQKVIKEADDTDKKIAATKFDLSSVNYVNVAKSIRMLLDKQTVQWQYTLGLVGLYDFWNPEKKSKKIPYAQLDAILRTLGQMQFTGYAEWAAVVAINKYFEPLHNAYVDATEKTYDIASKHQAVMQKMEEIQKGEAEQKAEDKKEPEA